MNRYFFYLMLMNMLTNILVYVPSVLIKYRFTGTMSSILLAIPIGFTLLWIFCKSLMKFPNQGLPEIFLAYLPKWLSFLLLFLLGSTWFLAGNIIILGFSDVTKRFINPDVSTISVMSIFIIMVIFLAQRKSTSILFALEIMLTLTAPAMFMIIFEAIRHENMDWYAVQRMVDYVWAWPNWSALAAATYLFSGYINMAIFHRYFKGKFQIRFPWLLLLLGIFNLLSAFLIPIGFHGTSGVSHFNYPWTSTTDSMRMEFGFVERVVFIFLPLYAFIALSEVIVHWHVGMRLFISLLPPRFQPYTNQNSHWKTFGFWVPTIFLATFSLISIIMDVKMNKLEITEFGHKWLNFRLFGEFFIAILIWILGRRRMKH